MSRKLLMLAAFATLAVAPATAQKPGADGGTEMHATAGAYFPARVGDFRRTDVRRFSPNGDDMGVTYRLNRPDGELVLTVYIYPATRLEPADALSRPDAAGRTRLCNQEFDQVRAVIVSQNRGADLSEEGGAPSVEGVHESLSRRSVYRFDATFSGSRQPVRSEVDLYCYVGDEWLVKYRATSNGEYDAAADIAHFIRFGPWPGRTPPPAPDEIVATQRSAVSEG